MSFVTNCHLAQWVGLSFAERLVLEFGSLNPEGSLFFSKFLSLVSFLGLALGLSLGFEPSSPIVRELVLSLTRLSFPLVRFRHNPVTCAMLVSTGGRDNGPDSDRSSVA